MGESGGAPQPVQPDKDVSLPVHNAPAPSAASRNRQDAWLSLVTRMCQGDTDALSTLYDETSGAVYGLALRMLRKPEDAEEVVLDVYSRAWRLAKNYDASKASVLSWLIMMARSICTDRLRASRPPSADIEEVDAKFTVSGDDPELSTYSRQQQQRVNQALKTLPDEQRTVLELAFFSGLSHSELAAKLGIPLGTVKTRARLGLLRLRTLLEDFAS